ncbi:MAG: hypothetical protein ACFE9I_14790 [Candidatus Hermodarchaeota archaeon]
MEEKFSEINQKLNTNVVNLEHDIKSLIDKIKTSNEDFSLKLKNLKEEFDTKEEVLRDMFKKFDEENSEFQNNLKPILEDIKSKQDLVKITLDVQKKQIFESTKELINDEIKLACKNKEKQILVNLWIDELKNIIENIDKLKALHPKDLKLYIEEISHTIESFRQKFVK